MASITHHSVLNLHITEWLCLFPLPRAKQLVQLLASLWRQYIIPQVDCQSTLILKSSYHCDMLLIAVEYLNLVQEPVHALVCWELADLGHPFGRKGKLDYFVNFLLLEQEEAAVLGGNNQTVLVKLNADEMLLGEVHLLGYFSL